MPSPNNCKGCIDSAIRGVLLIDFQLSSDFVNEDGNDNSTLSLHRLNNNNDNLKLIEHIIFQGCYWRICTDS